MSTSIRVVGDLSYDASKTLGEGSFGTLVFSGSHRNERAVAVKRMQKDFLQDDLDILQWEVEIMQKAGDHPNILRCICTAMNDDYLFIATELCSGTLDEYLKGKYQGPRFRNEKEILHQVTQGLVHLHNLKIVHRDIKPANLLIFLPFEEPSNPQMKLADFDISKMLKTDVNTDFTNTSLTNPSGSRGWMAPEVYELKRFDFKVDVWALGLIFAYTLSGGKHPFGDDPDVRTTRIKHNEPMLLTKTDLMVTNKHDAIKLIKSMLIVEAKDRPAVTDVLRDSFFFKDEVRTAEFLDVCKSFIRDSPNTNDKFAQFEKLVNDETVDVNATTITQDEEMMSPLHLLCCYYKEEFLIKLVDYLILKGADVNSTAEAHGSGDLFITGMTPLHLLFFINENMMSNIIDIVQLLLTNGADINAKNELGRTPLHYLSTSNNNENLIDIARFLVERGADVNAKDECGNTPLHNWFECYENKNLIDIAYLFLVQKGAHVNAKNGFGRTPLHNLCGFYRKENMKDIVQILVERGADVNAEDKFGWTPLHHLCASYKRFDKTNEGDKSVLISLVIFFVENGANIHAKDEDGNTPADILRIRGLDVEIVK